MLGPSYDATWILCKKREERELGNDVVAAMQVMNYNFPDPGVKLINGKYYAFGTNGGKGNIQAATSSDLVRDCDLR